MSEAGAPSSSSPLSSSSTSTPLTSAENPKLLSSPPPAGQPVPMPLAQEPSSEVEIVEQASKKRKAPATGSAKPAKKAKPAVKTATTQATSVEFSNDLVAFKNGKLHHKQKNGPKAEVVLSYLTGRAAFIEWAVEFFKSANPTDNLPEIPIQHLGAIARDVQEASQQPAGLARLLRNNLANSVSENMSATEDSQEGRPGAGSDDKDTKDKILERIDLDSLKKTIETIATRTNYGLSLEDLPDENLPPGVSMIPSALQWWVWEVHDTSLLSPELLTKLERRRDERKEIKQAFRTLYQSLSQDDQKSVYLSKKGGNGVCTASNAKKESKASPNDSEAKGKAKAKEPEPDDPENNVVTKPVKKKKELTEEEKAEKEEKLKVKAEKEAEKEEKRKEREAKKALKAEKDAIEEEKKAQKRKEKEEKLAIEEKKQNALKSQKNLMSNFFVKTSPTPAPATTAASASASTSTLSSSNATSGQAKADTTASSNAPAASSKPRDAGDFAKVFHPFTVRPGVSVAPINRFHPRERLASVKIDSESSLTTRDSLASFVAKVPKARIPPYNPYPSPSVSVRQAVVAINDSTLTGQDATDYYQMLRDRTKVAVKLLRFHEDVRAGYVGTWSKTSKVVTPRTPFGRDGALLNYEHDSEEEWEEEPDDPDAENVGSEGELSNEDDDEGNASEADSWLADDDEIEYEVGYEEDGDMVMMDADSKHRSAGDKDGDDDEDDDDVIVVEGDREKKERMKREKEKKRKKLEETKRKKAKAAGPMLALIRGPEWEDEYGVSKVAAFNSMKIRFLNDCSFGIDPLTFVSVPPKAAVPPPPAPSAAVVAPTQDGKENVAVGTQAPQTSASTTATGTTTGGLTGTGTLGDKKGSRPSKPFPEHLVQRFLGDIHGSSKPQPVIIDDFVRRMKDEEHQTITKASCVAKWKELGIKKLKGKLVVPDALL
ncbi:RLF2 family protein, partial [Sporobolomyces koalae]|uniref:RLF2 family protein n=1 Tax=Sporobolomyces koalae TaxID=500713 RepID=UPI0031768499